MEDVVKKISSATKFAAQFRGEKEIPDKFIEEVSRECLDMDFDIKRYPNGMPSAKAVYEIAKSRHNASLN
jgi:hypothetical protein